MAVPVDSRRQSGLWAQNPSTGFYEKQASQEPPSGPFQYYQPPSQPTDNGGEPPRRTFSQRAGNTSITDTFTAAIQNQVKGAGSVLDSKRIRDVALAAHAKIAESLHAHSGDAKSEDFARSSHAAVIHTPKGDVPFSFGGSRGVGGDTTKPTANVVDPNDIPENVRSEPWSPDPQDETQPITRTATQKSRQPSNASEIVRRGSVPDKSPLQKLEGRFADDYSKEEKRARLEEAESLHRQKTRGSTGGGDVARSGTLRSEKGRDISDGSNRRSQSTSDKHYRQVSAGAPQAMPPDYGPQRFNYDNYPSLNTLEENRGGLARDRSVRSGPPIANNPRPYHHAPSQPRSLQAAHPSAGAQPRIAREAQPYNHAPQEPTSVNVAAYPHNARRARASMDGESRGTDGGSRGANGAQPTSPTRDFGEGGMDRSVSGAGTGGGMQRSGSDKYKHRLRDAGFAGAAAAVAGAGAGAMYHDSGSADRGKALYESGKSQEQSPRDPVSPVTPTSANVGRSGSRKLQKRLPPSAEWRETGRESMDHPQRTSSDARRDRKISQTDRGATDHPQRSTSDAQRHGQFSQNGQQYTDYPQRSTSDAQRNGQFSQNGQQSTDYPERTTSDARRDKGLLHADRMDKSDKGEIPPADQDPDPVPRGAVATGKNDPVNYSIPPQTANAQAAREQLDFHGEQPANGQAQDKHHHFGGMFHRHGEEGQQRGYVSQPPLDEWRSAKVLRLTEGDLDFDQDSSGRNGSDGAWWEKQRRSSGSAPGVGAAQYDGPYEEEAKSFRPPLFLKCGPLLRYTGIRRETGGREIWRGSIMIVTEDENSEYSTVPTLRLFSQPMDLHTPPPKELAESGHQILPEFEDPVAGQVKLSRTGRPIYVRPVQDLEGGVDLSREENNQGLYSATRAPMLGPQYSAGPDGKQSPHIAFQDKSRIKGRDGEKSGRYREVKAIRLHAEGGFTFWRWSIEIELGSSQHRVAYRINRGPALGFWVPARGETMHVMFHSCNGFSLSVDPNNFSGPDPLWRSVLNRHQSRPFHVMLGGGDQIYNDAAMRDTKLFKEWLQTKNWEWKNHAEFSREMQEELELFYLNRYSMWFSQGLFAMGASQIPMVNLWDDHDIIDGFGSYPHHFMSTKVFTGLGAVAFKYYMLFQHQSLVAETAKEEPSWVLGASPGPYINELSRSVFLTLGKKMAFLGVDCRTERMRDEILSQESYDILFNRAKEEIKKGETKHLIVLLGVPIAYPRLNFLENILTSRAMDPIKAIGRTGMLGGFVNKFDGGVEILDDLDDHWTAKHHKAERNWFIQELQELAAEKSVRVTILGGDVHLGAVGQFYTPKKVGLAKDRDHRYIPNVISSAIVNTPPPPMMADVLNKRNKVHHLDDGTDEDMIPMFEVDVDGSKRNNKTLLPRRNYCTIKEFTPGLTPPPTPPPERSTSEGRENGQYEDDGYERNDRDRRYPPGSMKGRTMSLTRGPAKLMRRMSGSGRNKDQDSTGVGRSNTVGASAPASGRQSFDGANTQQRPTNMFHRRPTALSENEIRRAVARGGAPDEEGGEDDDREPGHINLEGGLDICLNMEVDQQDPSGATQPYRMLVPALWYQGAGDPNPARTKSSKGPSFMDRLRGRGKKQENEDDDYSSGSETPSRSQSRGQQYDGSNDQAQVARAGTMPHDRSYGNDGAYDAVPCQSAEQPSNSYNKGYNLTPPLGSGQQARGASTSNNNPYPQSGNYRRGSAPVSQKHSQQVPGRYARNGDEYSEGSLTPSDEYDDGPQGRTPGVAPRRFSKAERFFGIGDEGGKRPPPQDEGGYADGREEKSKPKWMVWR